MRLLISVAPASSHLQPVVPLARELLRRGHAVAVVSAPSFCSGIRDFGLEAIPAGLDWLRSEPERFFPEFADVPAAERCDWLIANIYAGIAPRRLLPEFLELCRSWRPDLILRDQAEFASWLAAERLGIPHFSYGYGLGQLEAELALMRPPLAAWRAELGLAPDDRLETLYRYARVEFAPPCYLPPDAPRIPRTRHLRFELIEEDAAAGLPDWVAALGSRPLVVATFGNNYNRVPGLFEAAIEALGGRDVDLVLAIGHNRDPAEFGPLPEGTFAERYLPLSRVLPRSDLLLCHAGFNTVMTAVLSGVPMALLPIDSDQPVHATRCQELGFGRIVDPSRGLEQGFRETVQAVLDNTRLRSGVTRFRDRMLALPTAAHAANLLEDLAAHEF